MQTETISFRGHNLTLGVIGDPPDNMLAWSYLVLDRQKMLTRFFSQGMFSLREFLEYTSSSNVRAYSCLVSRDGNECDAVGFGLLKTAWVSDKFQKGEVSMVYHREYQTPAITSALSRMMIDTLFQDEPDLAVIYGTIPAPNRPAILHARRLGFTVSSQIEHYSLWAGKPANVVVTSMTREDWNGSIQRREADAKGNCESSSANVTRAA